MASGRDKDLGPSCSRQQDQRTIEFDFEEEEKKGREVDDNSDDDDRDCIKFTPSVPSRPHIDLKGREVIFAIASFFLVSVCIGLIVILATMQTQGRTVSSFLALKLAINEQRKRRVCLRPIQPTEMQCHSCVFHSQNVLVLKGQFEKNGQITRRTLRSIYLEI